jgi:hypothetical protein
LEPKLQSGVQTGVSVSIPQCHAGHRYGAQHTLSAYTGNFRRLSVCLGGEPGGAGFVEANENCDKFCVLTCDLNFERGLAGGLFFESYYFSWTVSDTINSNVKVSYFLKDFELCMTFGRFGQTRVECLCMLVETFWLIQMVLCGPNVMYHHTTMCPWVW